MASRQAAIAALAVRGAGHPEQLAAYIASRTRGSKPVELASPRYPVTSPGDILVARSVTGGASIRHRRGGGLIGEIQQDQDGWRSVYDGRASTRPFAHQRGALTELLGLYNRGTTTLGRQALQPQPEQTPLMAQYGVPAVNALAWPVKSASDGPRTTGSEPDADDKELTPKGHSIRKKLKAKGWPHDKAHKFAKRAQSFGGK